jgi:carbohydrate binding protein with CBM6 domain/beta-propeller repeat-containing protein
MLQCASIASRRPLVLFSFLVGFACPATAAADARMSESYGKLPLHFEPNRGQTQEDVRFLSRGPGYSLYLTAGEAVLVLAKTSPEQKAKSIALRMSLVGADRKSLVSGIEELPGKANYFIGKDQSKWRTNVPTFAKVHYSEVYPGIDLVYYGNQRQLEYDFVVKPGADPKKIVLGFKGTDKLEIDAQGDLVLHAPRGAIRQKKPIIYQEIDGTRREIAGSYVRKGANRVGFKVAAYDASRPLVIDPIVLSYSTYLGGTGNDYGSGIAVDAEGNTYVAGLAASADFPVTAGSMQPAFGGAGDAFVTKLNPTGSGLVYSTYLGGSGHEHAEKIAVDANGNAYVTGHTRSSDFPTTAGAFQTLAGGEDDVFVAKLDPTGSGLVYSTYLGGSGIDFGLAIAVNATGNVHVTGYTNSPNFPTTAEAVQRTPGGGYDAFVTQLDPAGSGAVYSTYLGGSGQDYGRGIAVDASGNAYTAGSTDSSNFPATPGAYRSNFAGGFDDPFVTKLNAAGALVYSTYLGGSSNDRASGIAVDASGYAYIVGTTLSLDFPTTLGAFQPVYGGGDYDGYVIKLDPTGSALVYATYLGGLELDYGQGIAVDTRGNTYVTGTTYSANFPTTAEAFQRAYGGGSDAFVTQLDPTGSALVYSTYLGGTGEDWGSHITLDSSQSPNAYVAGYTDSINFPVSNAYQAAYGGGPRDAFVAKIADTASPPPGSTPFTGTPIAVPGAFEAENFDRGGEGVAYHDNVPGNAGGQYRTSEDVDIIVSSDPEGGGYVVNNFETGEWLAYTINVQASARYDIELRASSAFSNSAFHVEIDGVNVTGTISVPNTGSWNAFQWVGKTGITLSAGQHVLKIVTDQQYFNLNAVRVTATPASTSTPYTGTSFPVPGTFEAENFDRGGEGVAYHDNVPGNAGGQYRTSEDVDIIVSSDPEGGGYVMNNFETGEWLAYSINVPASGSYGIELRASTSWDFPNAAYHVEIDGVDATGTIMLPDTGGWNSFQWVGKTSVSLAAGQHVLKIVADRQYFNLNSIRVTQP